MVFTEMKIMAFITCLCLLVYKININVLYPPREGVGMAIEVDIHMPVCSPSILNSVDMAVYGQLGSEVDPAHGDRDPFDTDRSTG